MNVPPPDFIPVTPMTKEERLARTAANGHARNDDATIDAHALLRTEFPPIKWVIPDMIAEGFTVLAGKPKIGKSWLNMGLALSVATGNPALGCIAVEQGDVLYLALEDNQRRLKSRLRAVKQDGVGPDMGRLTFATEWPRLDQGGLDKIESWIDGAQAPRMVLIDTWAKVRSQQPAKSGTMYDEDYNAVSAIQAMANRYNVGMVATHHTKKGGESDPLDEISGSTGLSGAADAAVVLKRDRTEADATLYATGREIDEVDWALQFDKDTGLWVKIGDAAEYRMSKERLAIKRCLDEGPMTPKEVAADIGTNPHTTKNTMRKMWKAGDLDNNNGHYSNPVVP